MKVSIIIPTYNAENDVEECLNSVFTQTYPNIEVICIDNNSADKTWAKLQELQTKYPRLIIDKEIKQGASSARNKGLSITKGEWIQFLDADDLLLPDKIEHQVKIIKNYKPNLIAGAYKKELLNKSILEINPGNDLFYNIFTTNLGITSSNLWKKTILTIIDGWNEEIQSSQEYDLMFRYIKETENVFVDTEINTIIRERESSISKLNLKENRERFVKLRAGILDYLIKNKPEYYQKNKQKYLQCFFGFIRTLYPFNPILAIELFNKYIPKNFKPQKSSATTIIYTIIYKFLGFKFTEKIKIMMKK